MKVGKLEGKMLLHRSILIIDTETDSLDTHTAKIKWFGAYSYQNDEYYLIPFKGNEKDIKQLIKQHRVIVGFNQKEFDNLIIENNLDDDEIFKYRTQVDLLEMSAAPISKKYGKNRKNRLAQMGIKLKSFTLKNIIENLKLDEDGTKGDIDYKIFQKDEWTDEEITEITKYLKQDIDLTKKLFEWYETQFSPLKKFLKVKDRENFLYLRCSLAVLAYNIICNKAGLKVKFGDKNSDRESFAGGHHIEPRWDLVKGNIISIDVVSMYPHMIMMGNLCSPISKNDKGWDGDDYYKLDGKYDNKKQGKIELALQEIFLERLKAKKMGDKEKNLSYKIVINSFYGTIGNQIFSSVYNRNSASDTTSMARTVLKKACKYLDANGFQILSGFTDSIYILIPENLTREDLIFYVNKFIEEAKSHIPFPMDSFKMDIEEEMKMIWFVAKNCYLYVTNKNEVKYKSTLLNTNTPKGVMKLFDEYMKPIIIEQLEIPFTKKELEIQMKSFLKKDIELAAQEYKVNNKDEYKVSTSLQYQISEKYGPGRHFLIPNKKGVGIGKQKNTKKKLGIRHCSIQEFREKNLTINDIDLKYLLGHLKSFYERNEIDGDLSKQKRLY